MNLQLNVQSSVGLGGLGVKHSPENSKLAGSKSATRKSPDTLGWMKLKLDDLVIS